MSRKLGNHVSTVTIVTFRAALRERLLSIVKAVPAAAAEKAESGASVQLRENRSCTLLLDPGGEDFNVEELVTTLRIRYPKLGIVVLERNDGFRPLPCEFGDGPLRLLSARKSPVARAVAASQWAVLQTSDSARASSCGDGARRADANEDSVCAAQDHRD